MKLKSTAFAKRRPLCLTLLIVVCTTQFTRAQINGATHVCAGQTANYSSANSAYTYQWTVSGEKNFAKSGGNISIEWGAGPNGSVELKTFDQSNNLIASFSKSISINAQPNPLILSGFQSNCFSTLDGPDSCLAACENMPMIYSAPFVLGASYNWELIGNGNMTTISANQIEVEWQSLGVQYIKLTVTNAEGCSNESEKCVRVSASPTADIGMGTGSSSNITVCKGGDIFLSDLSTASSGRRWDFGDGTASDKTDITHSYTQSGTYEIILTAFNDCHCLDFDTLTVVVEDTQGPEIVCPGVVCKGDTVSYSTPSNCTSFNWSVVGGTILGSPSSNTVDVVWYDHPAFIELEAMSCNNACNGPTVEKVPVIKDSITIIGASSTCKKSVDVYSVSPLPGSDYSWTVQPSLGTIIKDQGYAVTVEMADNSSPGGLISLAYSNPLLNCSGNTELYVNTKPPLEFSIPNEFCFSDSVIWGLPMPVDWFILDSSNQIVYSDSNINEANLKWSLFGSGDYTLHLGKRNNFCNDLYLPFTILEEVNPPDTIYGKSTICSSQAYLYQVPPKNGYQVEWLVEGGSPSSFLGNELSINWNGSPPFKVSAAYREIDQPNCLSEFFEKPITSNVGLVQDIIGIDSVCGGDTATIQLNFVADDVEWTVFPNDGASIISDRYQSVISVQFSAANTTSVQLRAIGSVCGTNFNETKNIFIQTFPNPSISISDPNPCPGTEVRFSTLTPIINPEWLIDGRSYFVDAPTIAFDSAKTVSAKVTAQYSGPYGCMVERIDVKNLEVKSAPKAIISVLDSNNAKCDTIIYPVYLSASLQGQNASSYSYVWLRNGLIVATGSSYSPPFNNPFGNYMLGVAAPNGCISYSDPISINCETAGTSNCIPIATDTNISASVSIAQNGCNSFYVSNVMVNNATLIPPITITPQTNGMKILQTGPYNAGFSLPVGQFSVRVSGRVYNGIDTLCFWDYVYPTVDIATDFSVVRQPCSGSGTERYKLINTSTYSTSPPVFNWGLSSGLFIGTPTSYSALAEFPPGNHTITLTANGTNCSYSRTINVDTAAVASFTSTAPACQQENVYYNNSSSGDIAEYKWNFDGKVLYEENPVVTFEDPAISNQDYFVDAYLYLLDEYGCRDTASQQFTIHGNEFDASSELSPANPLSICQGDSINLFFDEPLNSNPNTPLSYQWSNQRTVTILKVKQTGNYQLSLTDSKGCRFVTNQVNMDVQTAPNPIIVGKQTFCDEEKVKLSTLDHPSYTLNWTLNGNAAGSGAEFEMDLAPGNHLIEIDALSTSSGCPSINPPFPITVLNQLPVPYITANSSNPVCEGSPIQLTASSAGGNYYWSTGQSGNSISQSLAGNYTVYSTNASGCSSSNSFAINPLPDFTNFMLGCYCLPYFNPPDLPGILNMASYQWKKNGQPVSAPNGQLQDLPASSGSFELIAVTDSGCVDSAGYMDVNVGGCEECDLSLSNFEFQCSGTNGDSLFFDFSLIPDLQSNDGADYSIDYQLLLNGQAGSIYNIQPAVLSRDSTTINGVFYLLGSHVGDSICLRLTASNPGVNCSAEICDLIPPLACDVVPNFSYTANPYTCRVQLSQTTNFGSCTSEDSVIYSWTITQDGSIYTGTGDSLMLDSLSPGTAMVCLQIQIFNPIDSTYCIKDSCQLIEVPDCNCYNNCANIEIQSTEFIRFIQQNDSCILEFKVVLSNDSNASVINNYLKSQNGEIISVSSTFSGPNSEAYLIKYYPSQPWNGGERCFDFYLTIDGMDCCQSFCVALPKCNCDLSLSGLRLNCSNPGSPNGWFNFSFIANLSGSTGFNYDASTLVAKLDGNLVPIVNYSPTTLVSGQQIISGTVDLNGFSGSEVCFDLTTSLGGISCNAEVCADLPLVPCELEPSFTTDFDPESCTFTITNTTVTDPCIILDSSAINWTVNYDGQTHFGNGSEIQFFDISDTEVEVCMSIYAIDYTGTLSCADSICESFEVAECECGNNCEEVDILSTKFDQFIQQNDSCILRFELVIDNLITVGDNLNALFSDQGDVVGYHLISSQAGINTYSIDFYPNQPWNGGEVCFEAFLAFSSGVCCLDFCVTLPKCYCDFVLGELNLGCTGPYGTPGDFNFNFLTTLSASQGFNYADSLSATLNGVSVNINSFQPAFLVNGSQNVSGTISLPSGLAGDTLCITIFATLGGNSCSATICDTLPEDTCNVIPSFSWDFDQDNCELILTNSSELDTCSYLQELNWTINDGNQIYSDSGQSATFSNLPNGTVTACLTVLALNYTETNDCHPDSCIAIDIPKCTNGGDGMGFERIAGPSDSSKLISSAEILIYPNPTHRLLNVEWLQLENKKVSYQLFDYQKKLIAKGNRMVEGKQMRIDLENLIEGVYVLEIQWDGKLSREKVVLLK